jgi:hypothetical protein
MPPPPTKKTKGKAASAAEVPQVPDESAPPAVQDDGDSSLSDSSDGTSKRKGKGRKAGDCSKYPLTAEQEQRVVDWLRESVAVWRRGHPDYKFRKLLFSEKAEELCLSTEHLMGWWKSAKDQYVKFKNSKDKKYISDRQRWLDKNLAFYFPYQTRNNPVEPTSSLSRTASSSSTSTSSESLLPEGDEQPPESLSLEEYESKAAAIARRQSSTRQSRSPLLDDPGLQRILRAIEGQCGMMAKIVRKERSGRESFIQYLQECVRDLTEEQYLRVQKQFFIYLAKIQPEPSTSSCSPAPPPMPSAPPVSTTCSADPNIIVITPKPRQSRKSTPRRHNRSSPPPPEQ